MSNIISIGSSQISCINGFYSLNDLHKASGGANKHRPNYFLENKQTKDLISEIQIAGIPVISTKPKIGTYACKELVIAYAAWISPAFHLKVIRVFLDSAKAPATNTLPAVRVLTTTEQTNINQRAHVLAQEKYREIRDELMADYLAGQVNDLDKWKPKNRKEDSLKLPFRPVSMSDAEREVIESVFRTRRYLMYFDCDGKPVVYGLDNDQFITSTGKLSASIREGGSSPFTSLQVSEILQACADRLAYESQRGRQ